MRLRLLYLPHSLHWENVTEDQPHPRIAEAQKILVARGYLENAADGIYDAATREALALFQSQEKIAVTGRLDPVTFCRLAKAAESDLAPAESPRPRVGPGVVRPNILINKAQRRLTLFSGNSPVRQFPVAIGKTATPTPLGNYAIATKIMNPGGVLGTRWMGLNYDAYGIHGTNRPWLIGQMVSNGCIRMHNHNAEELFALIIVGTPVYIRD